MRHSPVSLRDVDVLKLAVHVVFGFYKFAAVGLAGVYLDGDLVTLDATRLAMIVL